MTVDGALRVADTDLIGFAEHIGTRLQTQL